MPFFDDLTKKMGDAAKSAAKKSEELIEVAKLNRSIGSEEDKIKELHTEMGKTIYKLYKNQEYVHPDLLDACKQISEAEENINALKDKIVQVKAGQPEEQPAEKKEESTEKKQEIIEKKEEAVEQPAKKFCASCGSAVLDNSKFCPSCGGKL